MCPVERVVAAGGQPRQHFDETELADWKRRSARTASSSRSSVRRVLAHRERIEIASSSSPARSLACIARAGLKEVLVVVKDVSRRQLRACPGGEPQRADLTDRIAEAYDRLLREPATATNRSPSEWARPLDGHQCAALVEATTTIRSLVISRELSEGHARACWAARRQDPDRPRRPDVRGRGGAQVERCARRQGQEGRNKPAAPTPRNQKSPPCATWNFASHCGARHPVEVEDQNGAGLLHSYGSLDELDRILSFFGRLASPA